MQAFQISLEASIASYRVLSAQNSSLEQLIDESEYQDLLQIFVSISEHVFEGRAIRCNIMIFPMPIDLTSIWNDKWVIEWGFTYIPFANLNLADFDISSIRQILVCADEQRPFVSISRAERKGEFAVGLLYIPVQLGYINSNVRRPVWFKKSGGIDDGPDVFGSAVRNSVRIRIQDREIRIGTSRDWLASIKHGQFSVLTDYRNYISGILECCPYLLTKIEKTSERIEESALPHRKGRYSVGRIREDFTAMISLIINDIRFSGHGALLVFGTSHEIGNEELFHPGGIEINLALGEVFLAAGYTDYSNLYSQGNDEEMMADRLGETTEETKRTMIRCIIELSKTDGAIVFDQNATAIGAGVFLKSGQVQNLRGGARHRSAAGFVRLDPGSMTICISQDGSVRAFLANSDTVEAIP